MHRLKPCSISSRCEACVVADEGQASEGPPAQATADQLLPVLPEEEEENHERESDALDAGSGQTLLRNVYGRSMYLNS